MHPARCDLEIHDTGALQAQGCISFWGYATGARRTRASGDFPCLQPGETKHSWPIYEHLLLGWSVT